jgi:hypothetical protein
MTSLSPNPPVNYKGFGKAMKSMTLPKVDENSEDSDTEAETSIASNLTNNGENMDDTAIKLDHLTEEKSNHSFSDVEVLSQGGLTESELQRDDALSQAMCVTGGTHESEKSDNFEKIEK